MSCPHCGMSLYKKVGDVKFFCCGSSVGTRVEPITDACREIARLKEQARERKKEIDRKDRELLAIAESLHEAQHRADTAEERVRVLEGLVRKMYAEDDQECITNLNWATVQEVWEVFPDLVPDSYKKALAGGKGVG